MNLSANVTTADTADRLVPTYEHPFTERMRLLLRLEIIFAQAIRYQTVNDYYETQLCLDALFALLNLTKRYELRAELLRELERVKGAVTQLQHADDASHQRINKTLSALSDCSAVLHKLDSKHIDLMRNVEFLNTVKNRNVHDTGSYLFELPALQHWLLQSASHRQRQIRLWLEDFMPFKQAIDCLLRFVRESAQAEQIIAESGVYIKTVDQRSANYQLLRIRLPEDSPVYPRVSGDKYRFAIRFMMQKQVDKKSVQASENIAFGMYICGI